MECPAPPFRMLRVPNHGNDRSGWDWCRSAGYDLLALDPQAGRARASSDLWRCPRRPAKIRRAVEQGHRLDDKILFRSFTTPNCGLIGWANLARPREATGTHVTLAFGKIDSTQEALGRGVKRRLLLRRRAAAGDVFRTASHPSSSQASAFAGLEKQRVWRLSRPARARINWLRTSVGPTRKASRRTRVWGSVIGAFAD